MKKKDFPSLRNTHLFGTISPHGDQRLMLMQQNIISEDLIRVRYELVMVKFRVRVWDRLSTLTGNQCIVPSRIAAQTSVFLCSEDRNRSRTLITL